MAVKIQFRRDTQTNWENTNPVLSQGEVGLDLTNDKFKIGNGVDAWNALPYAFGLNLADQTEAEAGTDNEKLMTPLRTKQHVDNRIEYLTTTIATGNWSGTDPVTAVKTVSGILDTDKPLIDIDLSAVAFADVEDKQTEYAKIYRVAATDDDEITFYALEAPTEELVIQIKVVR